MHKLMRRINAISRCAALFRTERYKDSELYQNHSTYILTICRNPGLSQEQLAGRIYINKSNVARQLAYLEQHGFIERHQCENDKRVLLVYPTQKAQDILPFVLETNREWNEYLTEDFTEEELEQFTIMLDRVEQKAKSYFNNKETDSEEIPQQ